MDFDIAIRHDNGYAVITPRGEIDLATNPLLRQAIDDLVVAGDIHIVVDLTETEFIDSTGLGALIGGRRKTHTFRGSFALVCGEEQLLKLFRITGLDKVFQIHLTLLEATSRPPTEYAVESAEQIA
jgi:anti-sigma B factor antagonist